MQQKERIFKSRMIKLTCTLIVGLSLIANMTACAPQGGSDAQSSKANAGADQVKQETKKASDASDTLENGALKTAVEAIDTQKMLDTVQYLSKEDGGRMAGKPGEKAAAQYLSDQFKAIGLEVKQQPFPVQVFNVNELKAKASSGKGPAWDMAEVRALNLSGPTPKGGLKAELVLLGMGADADFENYLAKTGSQNLTDKIVMIQRGGEYFRLKAERALRYGASGVVFYDPQTEGAVSATLVEEQKLPCIAISSKDAQQLLLDLDSGAKVTFDMVVDCSVKPTESSNVIGVYPSKQGKTDKQMVLGAHYDGVDTPAADDNASGVAVITELARILVEKGVSLPYNVVFIGFGAEEIGLLGSTHYVENMTAAEISATQGMLNFDMVGVGDTFHICTVNNQANGDLAKQAKKVVDELGYPVTEFEMDRSDHVPFAFAGMEALLLEVGDTETYHTDGDNFEGIVPDRLHEMAVLALHMLMR